MSKLWKFVLSIIGTVSLCFLLYRWYKGAFKSKKNGERSVKESYALPVKSKRLRQRARRVFVSHSWNLSSHNYHYLIKNLRKVGMIYNHSIPRRKARPFCDMEGLYDIFRRQMLWCSKIFVLVDEDLPSDSYVYTEVAIASELGKEIIAVHPNSSIIIPRFIRRRAHHIISNDLDSIKRILN